jgi:zinc protease
MRGLALAILFLTAEASAQTTAQAVLDRYIEVTGGLEAYGRIRNLYSEGLISGNLPGMGGRLTAWEAAPDLSLTVLELGSGETVKEGTINGTAWQFSSRGGPQLKEGSEKAAALREGTFHSRIHWRKFFPKVTLDGEETVGGQPAWKITLTPPSGRPITHYYDRGTGLLVKTVIVLDTAQGEVLTENYFSEYRPVDLIRMPHRMVHRVKSEEIVVTLLRVEPNANFPMHRFDPPPEVRVLMRAAGRK